MSRNKCDGHVHDPDQCHGPLHDVLVHDPNHQEPWEFTYCIECIMDDLNQGYDIEIKEWKPKGRLIING